MAGPDRGDHSVIRTTLLAAVMVAVAGAAAASPIAGVWRTASGDALIEIYDCGDKVCGRVKDSAKLRANPNLVDDRNPNPALRGRSGKGLEMMQGFSGGPTEWRGGRIYNPEDGRTYSGSLRLASPDLLKLAGCIVYPLCRTQTWTRAK